MYVVIFNFALIVSIVYCSIDWSADKNPEKWNKLARENIDEILNRKINKNVAKNIIFFIGDGMGIGTVTAGRIRKGQMMGMNGEEMVTNMESLENLALSKTYNIDAQTADSAGTGTAYLCGVKTRAGIIGLNGHAVPFNCSSSNNTKLDSILKWAHKAGKSTGIVTTTRITHATPAAAYAHAAFRDWESYDGIKFTQKIRAEGCTDIAYQLIEDNDFINVILGGGRSKFIPNTIRDPTAKSTGSRIDRKYLLREWVDKMITNNKTHKFISNASDFRSTNFSEYEHILGLLAFDHMSYEIERDDSLEPSLTEMTLKAIDLLKQNKNGYFLLVEGGRIDHGHHNNQAHKAIGDFVAFDEAIGHALKTVSLEDTLIVVTADHSHAFTIGGNSLRGNPVYGLALTSYVNVSDANLTYTSILYGNGPGGLVKIRDYNLTLNETQRPNYMQEATVYRKSATHSGEDVSVYASGPMSFMFTKTIEQNVIPHILAYSACIGPYYNDDCRNNRGALHNSNQRPINFLMFNLDHKNSALFGIIVILIKYLLFNGAFLISF
ncbi:unnamed protein product [Brachionus calyciflorus]|uniref:Alkaline phosphatase, tissue-nonspecific isozyme n=1 Tax=Brachionus calyciflorus TaxID=104777 RepID=A0A814F3X0_9BILA|nr:unnamed protein product [Brachionus calyciflorus]